MLQDLAALAPPAIICAAFLVGAWVIVRKELAPGRRRQAEPAAPQAESALPAAGSAAVRPDGDQDAS